MEEIEVVPKPSINMIPGVEGLNMIKDEGEDEIKEDDLE